MSRFFIDRPIFAWVIAIVIMLAGVLAIPNLPINQYPDIAPPTVSISANYPGASAKTVEDSVTQIIEQKMTGLDGLLYFSSTSSSSGSANISLSFEAGTDPDIAQVQVQNKLQLAMTQLPDAVQRQGVRVAKSSTGFLQVFALTAEDGSLTQTAIADEFAFFADWSERYQYLIDLGRKLPALPDAWKTDEHRLLGCQSLVWIVAEGNADNLVFLIIIKDHTGRYFFGFQNLRIIKAQVKGIGLFIDM